MTLRGFPPEAFSFYEGLEADNSKAYWTAHKEQYDKVVRDPMRALTDGLAPRWGAFHMFRPHRDTRFSKDKSPYKTAQGAVGEGEGGTQYYLQISATGLMIASGFYFMAPDQLERFRAAVDAARAGAALARAVERARADGSRTSSIGCRPC